MNHDDIGDVKHIRKKLGLTQSALAKASGVSQSLIAKIESAKIDPTYSNMQKIFSALDSMQKKDSLTAKDFLKKDIISCREEDLIRDVIKKMKRYEISQLPVITKQIVVGVVSETEIINHLLEAGLKELKVRDVMSEAPPILSPTAPEAVISNLLKHFSLVIVQEKGRYKGVITRSDILRKIYG